MAPEGQGDRGPARSAAATCPRWTRWRRWSSPSRPARWGWTNGSTTPASRSRPSHELSSAEATRSCGDLRGAFCARGGRSSVPGSRERGAVIKMSSVEERIPKPNYLGPGEQGRHGQPDHDPGPGVRQSWHQGQRDRSGATVTPINWGLVRPPDEGRAGRPARSRCRGGHRERVAAVTAPGQRRRWLHRRPDARRGRRQTLYAEFREPWPGPSEVDQRWRPTVGPEQRARHADDVNG